MGTSLYLYMKKIKANVTYNWKHKNSKFKPGDAVVPNVDFGCRNPDEAYAAAGVSRIQMFRMGEVGTVIAASCAGDGNLRGYTRVTRRGRTVSNNYRQYTRYYVQFPDGEIFGFHSHILSKA